MRGKGDNVRRRYIYNGVALAQADWLRMRGAEAGPLFYAIRKVGAVLCGQGLSAEALAQLPAKRAAEASVNEITWRGSPRTHAGNLLDGGADLVTEQELTGDSSSTTTSR
jgi:hypothetical protein